ncbi:MAG: nucleotidyltransferase domain-containing protein [Candidatus Methanomethyliaceae archaeon]|nr:nucleotidyltransferase domain-containing protein [Candidatus Methanomethyliaceae archaeon]MDW7971352.1 nucleotidyltransferase domain-containing protein [Nitrososphaerota archaeon]
MLRKPLENEELLKAVERILKNFNTKAIILFGSRARGDYKPWSDYDILIIAEFNEKYLDRIAKIFELLNDINIPIEPHPYTINEAIEMLKRGNPIIVNALSEGLMLHIKEEFKELLRLYEELVRRGLRRTEVSIIVPEFI